ncbi:hypothetical protein AARONPHADGERS_16 [Bacillus phage AaronPhadgers]|nr:hypothetical protein AARONPHADGERS_16 [Bacillus phage AaronPhadgers]
MFKRFGAWLCKRGRHDREVMGSRYSFGMLTVKTKCKRCGKEETLGRRA